MAQLKRLRVKYSDNEVEITSHLQAAHGRYRIGGTLRGTPDQVQARLKETATQESLGLKADRPVLR